MLEWVYLGTVVLSIVYLFLLLAVFQKHISAFYTMLGVAVLLNCLGSWIVCRATVLESALVGNLLIYFAACFVNFFMLHCLAELCHTKIPRFVNAIFLVVAFFVLGCAMTYDKTELFYRSVELVQDGGVTHLKKVYGPLHAIYPVFVVLQNLYGFAMVGYSLRKRRETARFTSVLSLMIMVVTAGVYLIERARHSPIEWLPMANVISLGIILVLLNRVKLYDLRGFAGDYIATNDKLGFVLQDKGGRFEGADGSARRMFPELDGLNIDQQIPEASTPFLRWLKAWVDSGVEVETLQFQCDSGAFVEANHVVMSDGARERVHCVRLRDNTDERRYRELMEEYNSRLERDVAAKTEKIVQVQNDIIVSMANIVESRDSDTGGHIQRTSAAVKVFVNELLADGFSGLTEQVADKIIKAAPLHDFGKIAIPDVVLNKPGKFTPEEYEIMKGHSAKGASIVARILQNSDDEEFTRLAVNIAHYHHERWDGKGYPKGLSGTEIPMEARIMALADVFDALVSKRVYKEQFSFDKAFSIIQEGAGTQFDPVICARFLDCRPMLEELYRSDGKAAA